jgi:transketolase C-terminal domain/subunit
MKESILDGQIWSAHVVTVEGHRSVDGLGEMGRQTLANQAKIELLSDCL